ncbi:uncharacterized protein LOC143064677 isoform X3 [Mytilus galloprovincialis]|uniref:uncharacterized protein LOC143064677 isoform X3 n=1 Tax=Mytilus galloprovincialis TaxID=29158 RepID=UPI003F7C05EE
MSEEVFYQLTFWGKTEVPQSEELKAGLSENNNVPDKKGHIEQDGPPDDIRAFFGHPLAATTSINGEDTQSSAAALLHEYINLPALDKSGLKIGEKLHLLQELIRDKKEDLQGTDGSNDYMSVLQTEVDRFFNMQEMQEKSKSEDIVATSQELVETQGILENVTNNREVRNENDIVFSSAEDLSSCITTSASNHDSDDVIYTTSIVQSQTTPHQTSDSCIITNCDKILPNYNESIKHKNNGSKHQNDIHRNIYETRPTKTIVKALSEKIMKNKVSQQGVTMPPSSTVPLTNENNGISASAMSRDDSVSDPIEKPEDFQIVSTGTLTAPNTESPVTTSLTTQDNSENMSHRLGSHTVLEVDPVSLHMSVAHNNCYPDMLVNNLQHLVSLQQSTGTSIQEPITTTPMRQNSYPVTTNNFYSQNTNYMYPPVTSSLENQVADRDIMLERFIQQQQFYQEQQQQHHQPAHPQTYPYATNIKENYTMKSPDSGYHEPCLSPTEQQNSLFYKKEDSNFQETPVAPQKTGKRRKSAPVVFPKQRWASDKLTAYHPTIPKLEINPTGYNYFMDTPISTSVRFDEDRITYVNKGQYYALSLEFAGDRIPPSQMVKSVIMVVFRDDKSLEDERKAWEFWHSRQHSYKQRVIDIDTKDSQGVQASNINEIAFNAVAVKWNPRDSNVKVNVAVHCLSTDFSNQKGVKGLPLHIQIDTFENQKDIYPIHRGYCQIKVFCDKGAERKTRDEEKRRTVRTKDGQETIKRKRSEMEMHWPPCERSAFYSMADSKTFPVLFTPVSSDQDDSVNKASPMSIGVTDDDGNSSLTSAEGFEDILCPPAKRSRTDAYYHDLPKVLLYVREHNETIYTALMLRTPTLQGLLQAVEEKYKIPAVKVKSTYKRSKKGILVRLDDNIVRHYSHESTFVIELNQMNDDKDYEIILSELDV